MKNKVIWLIVLLALVLRLISIDQSLWLDEGISVITATNFNYLDIITKFSPGDFHPPLYYLILKASVQILGVSEISSRMPSVLFGVLTVVAVYLLSKKLYNRKTAITAAILASTSPLLIYYSQEARMYAAATFFSVSSLYFFVSILKQDKISNWVGLIVFTVLALYTDYMPIFILPAYFFYLLIFRKNYNKVTLRSFIPALILILVFLSPWIGVLVRQVNIGVGLSSTSPAWYNIIGSATPKDFGLILTKFMIGRISPDNNLTYILFFAPVGVFSLILLTISLLRLNILRSILWFYLLTPIILAFLISFYVPIFSYFRLIFTLPVLYVILASAINNLNWTKPSTIMFIGMLAINLTSTAIYFVNPKFHREDWKSAANYVKSNSGKGTIVLFESSYVIPTFELYNQNSISAFGALDSFNPSPEKVAQNVSNYTQNANKVFLFQYLAPIADPQGLVFKSLVENSFQNTDTKDFRGVGFIYEFIK